MAKVVLKFILPEDEKLTTVHIFESPVAAGPFVEIDSVSAGTFPEFITEYTTNNAIAATDWFAIQLEYSDGTFSDLSAPILGDTSTLIGEIVDRVLLRSPSLDENIVLQEAEATIAFVYNVSDPYSIDLNTVNSLWLTELANLTMVAALYVGLTHQAATATDYTAGMISERTTVDVKTATDNLERLEKRALARLGIGGSLIASIKAQVTDVITFERYRTTFDSSRVLSARELITQDMVVRDLANNNLISRR